MQSLFGFHQVLEIFKPAEKRIGPFHTLDGRKATAINDNPLPHVLMLTAIVVGVSILAVALAIIINIKRTYGTIEYDEIREIERLMAAEETAEEVRIHG